MSSSEWKYRQPDLKEVTTPPSVLGQVQLASVPLTSWPHTLPTTCEGNHDPEGTGATGLGAGSGSVKGPTDGVASNWELSSIWSPRSARKLLPRGTVGFKGAVSALIAVEKQTPEGRREEREQPLVPPNYNGTQTAPGQRHIAPLCLTYELQRAAGSTQGHSSALFFQCFLTTHGIF